MRKIFTYLICCCIAVLLTGCKKKSLLPDLSESYAHKDSKPFGGYIARSILQNSFPDNYVQTLKASFVKNAITFNDTASIYFCLSRNLYLNQKDADAILSYVNDGNTAFFASANIDTLLLNRLSCKIAPGFNSRPLLEPDYEETTVHLAEEITIKRDSFSYYYEPFESLFSKMDKSSSKIIGYNNEGMANCIVFFWGKGRLFLHTDPRAFSNYFLLKENNYKYMQKLMQVMNSSPQHVYWDDYYNKHNYRKSDDSNSTLSEIFKYPPLKAAFLLSLLLLLLYILFNAKRKQRIIREIKPNQNSSVAFTETVARLYLQKHDNKNIADKMITYFNEFIRNNYYLNTNAGNKDFITALSRKSGVSEEKTIALFNAINATTASNTITDYQLLSLNEQIQQFYKKRK